ncbi:hypothetical protein WN55_10833 [Dufourea novaeangliae]|uniref:Uncharacterized protein n=1 Tax=Dufourea novaeangliae TaxID=178035 RepID=A0A154P9D5_DUFNO|nr:hypothetical protein WN55_10833 [Dufourea novaeangliae]
MRSRAYYDQEGKNLLKLESRSTVTTRIENHDYSQKQESTLRPEQFSIDY